MEKINNILNERQRLEKLNSTVNGNTVNSNYKNISTVYSISQLEEEINKVIAEYQIKPDGVAQLLAEGLDDMKSLLYYKLLAKENNQAKLLRALSLTKEAYQERKIHTYRAVYFRGILLQWGLKIKFKKD